MDDQLAKNYVMGLSFHYKGRCKNSKSLPLLIEEVKDIAENFNWRYHIYETNFAPGSLRKKEYTAAIYGISFTPPECETVSLCFLSNGRISSASHLQFYGNTSDATMKKYLYSLSVKTQYAGIEVHLLLMRLFKYLATKYLADFWLMDEGGFWGIEDEAVLQQNFNKYNFLIDSFTEAITTRQIKPGESLTEYFSRLLTEIKEKGKDK